jgi:hypothetical protein
MKNLYTYFPKIILIIFFSLTVQKIAAQTTLVAGDIAFTGYISAAAATDEFSFVLLKNVSAGTVINFTDNAWLNTGVFRAGEQTVTWTTTAALPAGKEVKISGAGAGPATATLVGAGSPGTCTGTMPSLSTSGDQVLAYQGTVASPSFISAIHMNVYSLANFDPVNTDAATWDNTNSNNTSASALPPGLTTGTTAIWVGTFNTAASEFDNANFNCSGPINTVPNIKARIYNPANWNKSSSAPTGGMVTPTGCNFLGLIVPVSLISFQAQNNLTNVIVKWQVTNEIDVSHYEVERSFDGKNFDKIGNVGVQSGSVDNNYNYTDYEGLKNDASIIYYRLKSIDLDGKFSYSNIASIRNNKGSAILVDNIINPVKNNLSFSLTLKTAGIVTLQLTDVNGKIVVSKQLKANAGTTNINLSEAAYLSNGMYFLRVSTLTSSVVTKIIK